MNRRYDPEVIGFLVFAVLLALQSGGWLEWSLWWMTSIGWVPVLLELLVSGSMVIFRRTRC